MNINISLDLNIDCYYINHLSYPYKSTRNTAGGPMNQTIKHLGQNNHHVSTVNRTLKTVNECIEKWVQHTRKTIQNIQVQLNF